MTGGLTSYKKASNQKLKTKTPIKSEMKLVSSLIIIQTESASFSKTSNQTEKASNQTPKANKQNPPIKSRGVSRLPTVPPPGLSTLPRNNAETGRSGRQEGLIAGVFLFVRGSATNETRDPFQDRGLASAAEIPYLHRPIVGADRS